MESRYNNCAVSRSKCPALVGTKTKATGLEITRREWVCEENRKIIDQSKPVFD